MSTSEKTVTYRRGARAFLLTPENELLLMRIRLDNGKLIWIAPGGGREDQEDAEACLRRELKEELGLEHFILGPTIWRRSHTFNFFDKRISQTDDYFVVKINRFQPMLNDPEEATVFDSFRWWKIDDLFDAKEPLTPLSLANIMRDYLFQGPPDTVTMEVLVD